jgi:hypothetical protein
MPYELGGHSDVGLGAEKGVRPTESRLPNPILVVRTWESKRPAVGPSGQGFDKDPFRVGSRVAFPRES